MLITFFRLRERLKNYAKTHVIKSKAILILFGPF